ncbi:hypothetical protein [Providencia phage PSTRCR_114]|uniref:Tail spike TSP1/Gp66 N-terminal domain-containing protein n=1 Tax=Providencia phage PSTRCR_114 TaxID=2800824 RepID=A0A7T6ZM49_9CAUD|nr:hypothetical protein [Providencia phage PSTRCR_114]
MAKVNRTVLHDSVPTFQEFSTGGVVRTKYDLFKNTDGLWEWRGEFPKTVPAGSTPESYGGIWSDANPNGLWVNVVDVSLRSEVDLYAIARANAVSMSDVQFLSIGQAVDGQHYWYDRVSEKIYLWVEPVSEGTIDGVVNDSDGVIKITVSGVDHELYSLSDFSLSLGDAGVLVLLNRNLSAAINLANKSTKIREIKLGVGDFLLKAIQLKKGITISGSGIDLGDLKGTRLKFDLQANEDAFAYLGTTYPPATITIQNLTMENSNFATPTNVVGAQAILNANNRGFWGVRNQPATDWKPEADWQKKKDGGANCQNLFIKNVLFEKFAYAWDVHSWMSKFEDVQTRYCGTSRTYGTSTDFIRVWPQYCLYSAYQLGMVYSRMSSSSLGEHNITGINAHGLQNFRGTISLYDCGWENVLGTVYDCFDGVVNVYNEIYVTDKSRRAAAWGYVHSPTARLNFFGVNKSYDSDGDITDPSWNWFRTDAPDWIKNIQFHEPLYELNLPIRNPHRNLEKNWSSSFYRGFFAHVVDSPKGELYFVPPTSSSRLRRLPCVDIAYKDSFVVLGDASKASVRFNIYGNFADDATTSKPKTGTLKIKITPEASVRPSTSGLIFYSEIGASEYIFTWSHDGTNLKGGQVRTGTGFDNQGDRNMSPVNAYFDGELNNDGFRVLLSVRAINNADNNDQEWKENVKYRVEFEYNGSCNNNALSTGNKRFEVQIV